MKSIFSAIWFWTRRSAAGLARDSRGLAATEFAIILPMMLVMVFGTIEFSSGLAVNRKVTLVARTLSDLTSQAAAVADDNYLRNVFTASISILSPYSPTPTQAKLSEIYVDTNGVARIQWSKQATIISGATQATLAASSRNAGDIISIPAELAVPKSYLIFSEVSYLYTPTIGYVMAASGVTLHDVAYTRPRQVACVMYNGVPAGCPTP